MFQTTEFDITRNLVKFGKLFGDAYGCEFIKEFLQTS